ncbi:ANTAR domain-containing protein [Cryobacterium adonitolivorans]|uniref:ANTAR domain-containing protein n=1 Tax=Cryobacterium adonitolivorans TaxID=1259189 RepID=A0A4R8W818_9MICO|nr:GAF and ANTAR domain-containing protein [Cryobacterium adonitolivorans]TFC04110.1 ANTAR domain-containing protein [Cryobacterium adonitolivorans]
MSEVSGTPRMTGGQLASPFLELLPITGAAISVMDQDRRASLIHATDPTAARLEEMQFDLGEGPSFDAFRTALLVSVPDLALADRWPAFLRSTAELTVGAIFTFPLMLGAACTGTVTCYRTTAGALDDQAAKLGASLCSAIAGPAFRRAIVLAEHESQDGEAPIESRREIHQATGMVLGQLDISATDAFSRIRAYAFSSGYTVQDISHAVVSRRLNFAELPE